MLRNQISNLIHSIVGQRRREIAEWVSDVDTSTPLSNPTPGTGKWLIKSDNFTRWEKGDFRVLYCPGDRELWSFPLLSRLI